MPGEQEQFDFWYAVNNTEIVVMPEHHLETFGNTILNYHMVSQLMDSTDQVRVREGRMQASQPQIVTPEAYTESLMEGFGEKAHEYLEWLRKHENEVKILQYGYRLKQESFSEHVVTDNVQSVVERVEKEVKETDDPLSAVLVGVDSPWDVCLVKLFWEVIRTSAGPNLHEMNYQRLFERRHGVTDMVHREIEAAFLAASRDLSKINALSRLLQMHNVFEQYQDRFFATVRSSKK